MNPALWPPVRASRLWRGITHTRKTTPFVWLLLLALAVASEQTASAATFTVDSTADAVDASPGDGLCADAGGACTLRAAIQETNALPGPDAIDLPGGNYALTIPGAGEDASATGDLDITNDLTIDGDLIVNGATEPGAIIDAGGLDRVIHVIGAIGVAMSGVDIRNGDVSAVSGSAAGILNLAGTVTLVNSSVRNNRASAAAGIGNSGTMTLRNVIVAGNQYDGIVNTGNSTGDPATIEISDSLIENNTGFTGGIFNGGGSRASILTTTIRENRAPFGFGGGVWNVGGGDLSVEDTAIVENESGGAGGGVAQFSGPARFSRVTFANNLAGGAGGGLYIASAGPMIVLENTTFSSNRAKRASGPLGIIPGRGGAIMAVSGALQMTNVTFAENLADDDGGAISTSQGTAEVQMVNTLFSANVAAETGRTCSGPIFSLGHNLEDGTSCQLTNTGDQSQQIAVLGSLGDNGGATQTHALLMGSPGIDAGDGGSCPDTDQRGISRPLDGDGDRVPQCDIGSYEAAMLTQTPGPTPIPSSVPTPIPSSVPTPGTPLQLPATGGRPAAAVDPIVGKIKFGVILAIPALVVQAVSRGRRSKCNW